ncbi:MAG: PAS domain-containing protein [Nitrospirae bacterium]|nr:PAS domain-containing protein [Nitrospirota bacterium]
MGKRRGIRRKVATTITLLLVVSMTLLGAVLSWQIFISQRDQTLNLQREVTEYAVNEISWDIHELETIINFTITSSGLMSLDKEGRGNILSKILAHQDVKLQNILDELILLDKSGREMSRVSRTAVSSLSELGERSGADEFIIPLKSGKTHYGGMTFDEATHEPMIIMGIPIRDIRSGGAAGVLMAKIRLNKIWENAVQRTFGKSGIIFITDSNGKVVAHPDSSLVYGNIVFRAEKQAGIQAGLNGDKAMLVSRDFNLGGRNFKIYASLPFDEVLSLSLNTLSITSLFLVSFMLLAIAVSYFSLRKTVQSVESLAENARIITSGKFVSAVDVGDNDEIRDLSEAFNIMTAKLLDTIDSLEKQMAALRQAKEKIQQQNDLMNSIISSLTHPFYVIDAEDYTIKLANPACHFGTISPESTCYSLTHHSKTPCCDAEHPCTIASVKKTGKPVILEHIHYNSHSEPQINEVHGYPIFDSSGKIVQVIEYNIDITERKKYEEKILASLKEKEILLSEIHHRVKNNMQIICSLLRLQSMRTQNPKDIEMLNDSQNRIKSMALIHEKLYSSKDLSHINFEDYIRDLASNILRSFGDSMSRIAITTEVKDVWLEIDTAIPCGLIINELISNSLKHAFPEGRKGEIRISLRRTDGEVELKVSDNGAGIPEGFDFRNTGSLGLNLIRTLSENQLQGSINLNREKGTEFIIKFKEVKYEERI